MLLRNIIIWAAYLFVAFFVLSILMRMIQHFFH